MTLRPATLAAFLLMLPATMANEAWAQAGRLPTRAQQQAACEPDARRLCGNFIPDEAQVSRCMVQNVKQVSAQCRAVMDAMRAAQGAGTRK